MKRMIRNVSDHVDIVSRDPDILLLKARLENFLVRPEECVDVSRLGAVDGHANQQVFIERPAVQPASGSLYDVDRGRAELGHKLPIEWPGTSRARSICRRYSSTVRGFRTA